MNATLRYWVDRLYISITGGQPARITTTEDARLKNVESIRADVEAALGTLDGAVIGDISGVLEDAHGNVSVSLEGVFTVSQLATIIAVATRSTP